MLAAKSFAYRAFADFGRSKVLACAGRQERILQAAAWIARAQDEAKDGGISYGWSLRGGWRPAYRETTGYLVPTLFDLADYLGDAEWRSRAIRAADWLVSVQNSDGSISNPEFGSDGIVFDTGQVLFGYVRAYLETNHPAYLQSAVRAGQWLVKIADVSLRWTKNEHLNTAHVYNARTAWALLELNSISPDRQYVSVARANLDWAVAEQHNGYFDQCSFKSGVAPFTHTIAYTIRGLLESALVLDDHRYLACAISGAEAMLRHLRPDGFMPGQVSATGTEKSGYCCLTGNCQLAICWLRIFSVTQDKRWLTAARLALNYVSLRQDVITKDLNVRGAVSGSYPIWGRYAPFSFPNWAVKFFIDAMILNTRYSK